MIATPPPRPWCDPASVAKLVAAVPAWERQQTQLAAADRIRRRLGYPDPDRYDRDFRRNPGPDPQGYDPMEWTPEELKFVRRLLDKYHRMPRVGEPGHRGFREAPNYYLRPSNEDAVPNDGGGAWHAGEVRYHHDTGSGVDGFGVETRPQAPKDEADRPAATADRLLDDALPRSGCPPVAVSFLHARADDSGISWATVVRAAKKRGIKSRRVRGTRGKSEWYRSD